jgi:A/G-specific adenine glycosylase
MNTLTAQLKTRLRRSLLGWYCRTKREPPWRRTHDPYRILVVEYMSQQTQVKRVLRYYDRFLEKFPDVQTLAKAPVQRVLKVWEGMGYYARARHLHAAAKKIMSDFGGRVPSNAADLITLPGCGPYTAAAIASIAFNEAVPVLDGNVIRVLCRLFGISDDPKKEATKKRLRALAQELIAKSSPGEFNQAVMELGALICTPRAPRCDVCCWNFACKARQLPSPTLLPTKTPKPATPHYTIAIGLVWRDGKILIGRRPAKGLLGGLWEFPGGKRKSGESLKECCAREIEEEVGVKVRVGRPVTIIAHAYSHFRITMHVFDCEYVSGTARPVACDQVKWVSPRQLSRCPFPAANRTLIERLIERR